MYLKVWSRAARRCQNVRTATIVSAGSWPVVTKQEPVPSTGNRRRATPRTPRLRGSYERHQHFRFQVHELAEGPRLLHVWRDWLHTFRADKLVYCGEHDDPIEKELGTLLGDLRSVFKNGGEVQSSAQTGFWSALGRNTTLNVEESRGEQSSARSGIGFLQGSWPNYDFNLQNSREDCLPEVF